MVAMFWDAFTNKAGDAFTNEDMGSLEAWVFQSRERDSIGKPRAGDIAQWIA